jgi:hypothetical protein
MDGNKTMHRKGDASSNVIPAIYGTSFVALV